MNFRPHPALEYLGVAPAALVFERVLEARLYPGVPFEPPILDIGCGEGLFARMAFADPIDTGIDPDARELERARELGAYRELIQCYGDRIPKPDGAYRTVFSNSVLEHIPELAPVFREVYRILAPGGRFHFTVPSPNFERYNWTSRVLEGLGLAALDARWRRFFNRFWVHHHAYAPEAWARLGREAGFEVEKCHAFSPLRSCLLNTTLTPCGLPAKILKKLSNRWTLFPALRRVLLAPLWALAERVLRGAENAPDGGLVFVSLRKPG